ncbi:hypothetical protein [Nonomuraea sp. SYSU D8015]|uniref:hypothetical protein n=1 Tax=Nonomuraea sp. SYSU D8015 TaxID=2593644 RepID=UPI0016615A01|nr:hypothetical protein [Nonomuraea sp. SYSU D8015]
MVQVLTVPIGLLTGIVFTVTQPRRPPGYALGAITTVFGVLVTTQGLATSTWADGSPAGIGDPDGEGFIGLVAACSGLFTTAIGLSIVLLRWAGPELMRLPQVRSRNAPARP